MKTIKYLACYNTPDNAENRRIFLSACNKSDYIINALERKGYRVDIISASNTFGAKNSPMVKKKISENVTLTLLHGFRRGGKFTNILSSLLFYLQLIVYLSFHLKRNDTLLVYHSTYYMKLVRFLKKIKGFKLILEIEEIYGDVLEIQKNIDKEIQYFQVADAYMFSTVLLNDKVNFKSKPYVVNNGTYQAEPVITNKFDDDLIHVVYAGTFDKTKGGAYTTIRTAEFLSNKYHVHIIGFGTDQEKQDVLLFLDEMSRKSKCKITYDGCLSGDEYLAFLQKCDIGMSSQNPESKYNDSSFPSKVLSYMANGLRVVSVRIPAIYTSDVGPYMYYYETQDPQAVASAISNINFYDGYDGRKVLEALDKTFLDRIDVILK